MWARSTVFLIGLSEVELWARHFNRGAISSANFWRNITPFGEIPKYKLRRWYRDGWRCWHGSPRWRQSDRWLPTKLKSWSTVAALPWGTQVKYRDRDIALERGATVITNAIMIIDTCKIIRKQCKVGTAETTVDTPWFETLWNRRYNTQIVMQPMLTNSGVNPLFIMMALNDSMYRFRKLALNHSVSNTKTSYAVWVYTNAAFWALNNVRTVESFCSTLT